MKRFAVFAGLTYYPGGGMADFVKSFDTEEEANAFIDSGGVEGVIGFTSDWDEIVDMDNDE